MKNRKQVEKYIIDSISKIDKDNADRYKERFKEMTDSQFDKFMVVLKDGDTNLFVILPNMKKPITNNRLFSIADQFKVNLFDQIKFVDDSIGRSYFSPKKYLILELPVRRVKQYLFGKIGLPESDKRVSKLSGQVMQEDKGCKLSLIETQLLANKNLDSSVVEILKIRGGDLSAYYESKQHILNSGSLDLSMVDMEKTVPKSAVVAEGFLKAMHIDVDFVRRGGA